MPRDFFVIELLATPLQMYESELSSENGICVTKIFVCLSERHFALLWVLILVEIVLF